MDQSNLTIREMGLEPTQVALLIRLVALGPGYHRDHDRHGGACLARLGLVDDLDAVTFGCNWWTVTPRGLWASAVLRKESA